MIIAHAPLATALRQCVAHVFPDRAEGVRAVDVQPQASPEHSLVQARESAAHFGGSPLLLLTDLPGATPSNVARALMAECNARLIGGVNLPMLLRAVTYQHEPIDALVTRALQGGCQGVQEIKNA
ncbi:MAG: PTS sugar transporter subunit IIA [bacterium]